MGNQSASITFDPPVDNGGTPIIDYTVTSDPGGVTATGTAPPIVVTGLTNGTSYTFTVHSRNINGNSVESDPSNAYTPSSGADILPPSIPSNVVATPVSVTEISVSWDPSTDNVGVTGYNVYRSLTETGTYALATLSGIAASPYASTGLTEGTTYYYKVTAYDAVGNESLKSNFASATPSVPAVGWLATEAQNDVNQAAAVVDSAGYIYSTFHAYYEAALDGHVVVTKYTPAGVPVWQKQFHQLNCNTEPAATYIDTNDNIFITGIITDGVSFNGTLLIKLDVDGNVLMQKNISIGLAESLNGGEITTDVNGNIYIMSETGGGAFASRVVLSKLSSTGIIQWQTEYGDGISNVFGYGVGVDASGNSYVGVEVENGANTEAGVVKFNSSGVQETSFKVTDLDMFNTARSLIVDSNNNIIIGGSTGLIPQVNMDEMLSVIKMDTSGVIIWETKFGADNTSDEPITSISVDGLGNIYVVAPRTSMITPDPTPEDPDPVPVFRYCTSLMKLSGATGVVQWEIDISNGLAQLLWGLVQYSSFDDTVILQRKVEDATAHIEIAKIPSAGNVSDATFNGNMFTHGLDGSTLIQLPTTHTITSFATSSQSYSGATISDLTVDVSAISIPTTTTLLT